MRAIIDQKWAAGPDSSDSNAPSRCGSGDLVATDDGEVRHLEGVGSLAAPLQRPRHTVAHVEVRGTHPGRQAELQHTHNQRMS